MSMNTFLVGESFMQVRDIVSGTMTTKRHFNFKSKMCKVTFLLVMILYFLSFKENGLIESYLGLSRGQGYLNSSEKV